MPSRRSQYAFEGFIAYSYLGCKAKYCHKVGEKSPQQAMVLELYRTAKGIPD